MIEPVLGRLNEPTRGVMRWTHWAAAVVIATACSVSARTRMQESPEIASGGAQLIPTEFVEDRIFAKPVTAKGDTLTILLDTGDAGRFFTAAISRLGWAIDSVPAERRLADGTVQRTIATLVSLPAFMPSRAIPVATPAPELGVRTPVGPPTDKFDTLMSRRTIGQLGQLWFADRVWTIDYLRHLLLLLPAMPPKRGAAEHDTRLEYRVDTAGRRLSPTPRVAVEVDGDTLMLLFDTGATTWLTDSALRQMKDGGPAERSWSLVRKSTLARWRARHPDWRVVEKANIVDGSTIIEVPSVRVAGFEVGPALFGDVLGDFRNGIIPPRSTRIDGTLGGSVLKYFTITLDYPNAIARFSR